MTVPSETATVSQHCSALAVDLSTRLLLVLYWTPRRETESESESEVRSVGGVWNLASCGRLLGHHCWPRRITKGHVHIIVCSLFSGNNTIQDVQRCVGQGRKEKLKHSLGQPNKLFPTLLVTRLLVSLPPPVVRAVLECDFLSLSGLVGGQFVCRPAERSIGRQMRQLGAV